MQPLARLAARGLCGVRGGGAEIAACLQVAACLSTSCSPLEQQQLVRTQQQAQGQQHGAHGPRDKKLWLAAFGASAAAGIAGWAAYNLESSSFGGSSSSRSRAAAQQDAARLAASTPRAQAALSGAVMGPLLCLLHGVHPTPAQLQGITTALEAEAAGLGPAELASALWGLAMLGAEQQHVLRLAAAVVEHMAKLPVYEAIITAWSVTMLCSNTSSSSSSSSPTSSTSPAAGLSQRAWQQLLQRLQAASYREYAASEPALLYLLHAAMQQAAAAAAAAGAGPCEQPRASLQELLVVAGLQQLPRRVQQRIAGLYQEYVPFQPYVEGPLLVVLHLASVLPCFIAAATAAAAAAPASSSSSSSSSGGPGLSALSPLVEVFGALGRGEADAAKTLVSGPGSLGKLKRDLYFRWRSDELLDRHQRVVNQVVHVLHWRMQLPVQQQPDLDVVLPSLRAAVLIEQQDVALAAAAAEHGGSRPSSTSALLPIGPAAAVPPSPFTPAFWAEARQALLELTRNRFAAPPGGFACGSCGGVEAARQRVLRARGWRPLVLGQGEVEAALGGVKAGRVRVGESPDCARLERLLRARLEI